MHASCAVPAEACATSMRLESCRPECSSAMDLESAQKRVTDVNAPASAFMPSLGLREDVDSWSARPRGCHACTLLRGAQDGCLMPLRSHFVANCCEFGPYPMATSTAAKAPCDAASQFISLSIFSSQVVHVMRHSRCRSLPYISPCTCLHIKCQTLRRRKQISSATLSSNAIIGLPAR